MIKKEINWNDIFQLLWKGRKTIIKAIIVFFTSGLLYLVFSPREYKSEITLVVETSNISGLSGMLQQLSGLAGISLDRKDKEALSPDLYPEVITSNAFLLELMNEKITEPRNDSSITIGQYIERYTNSNLLVDYTFGLPGKFFGWIKGGSSVENASKLTIIDSSFTPLKLSDKQYDIINNLRERITTEQEFKKNNKIVVSVEMQDPEVAAQVNCMIAQKLQAYIIQYRTLKARNDLQFISARTSEAELKYIEAQQALALFRDKNKNIILKSVYAEEERLKAEYDLASNVYSTLSQQNEQAKIKVQENTPVLIVMDPASIPLKKSKPKTILTLAFMIFLGISAGSCFVYLKTLLWFMKKSSQT